VADSTSEQDLVDLFGRDEVVRRELDVGEGMCAPGSVLYAGTADELAVTWTDTTYSRPAILTVMGENSRWRTAVGVAVGSTLAALDSLAGEPVQFTGFGWDYGGTGVWKEGTPRGTGEVLLQLSPDSASYERARSDPRYPEITGEQTVTSRHALIRELTIRVERILIRWAEPTVVRPCPGL